MKRIALFAILLALVPAAMAQHVVVRIAVFEAVAGPGETTPPDHADDRKWPTELPELWSVIGATGVRLTAINRLSMTVGDERDTDRVHVKLLSAGTDQARVEVRVDGSPGAFTLGIRYNETSVLSPANSTKPESVAVSMFSEKAGANVQDIFHVGGDVLAPVVTHRIEPVYPEDMKAMRISGMIILQTFIDETGKVVDAHVLKSLPGSFNDAALVAVKQWEFKPATRDGKPVAVIFNLVMQFKP